MNDNKKKRMIANTKYEVIHLGHYMSDRNAVIRDLHRRANNERAMTSVIAVQVCY